MVDKPNGVYHGWLQSFGSSLNYGTADELVIHIELCDPRDAIERHFDITTNGHCPDITLPDDYIWPMVTMKVEDGRLIWLDSQPSTNDVHEKWGPVPDDIKNALTKR
jgi:hypothetical protein